MGSFVFVVCTFFQPFHERDCQEHQQHAVKKILNGYGAQPYSQVVLIIVPNYLVVNEGPREYAVDN